MQRKIAHPIISPDVPQIEQLRHTDNTESNIIEEIETDNYVDEDEEQSLDNAK